MARKVDPKRTRKALRIVRKLAAKAATQEAIDPETGEIKPGSGEVDYSHWENTFLTEVDKRLQQYGSAFHNLSKGKSEEALSMLQTQKLKEIAAKASGKTRKGLTTKKPLARKKRLRP